MLEKIGRDKSGERREMMPTKQEIIDSYEHLLHDVRGVLDKEQREKWSAQEELAELQSLFELQHKRSLEADRLWQKAHNQPDVWPDLGKLLTWLIKKATEVRCCRNCENHFNASCAGCAYAMKNPADGKDMWTEKKGGK